MKNKNTLVNVLILPTATHFLKKWLMGDDKEDVKEVKQDSTLKRKKEQLLELFS